MRDTRADYGIDGDFSVISARGQAVILGAVLVLLAAWTVRGLVTGAYGSAAVTALVALALAGQAAFYLRTTRVGKFEVWAAVLAGLALRGDERVLDLGCGR